MRVHSWIVLALAGTAAAQEAEPEGVAFFEKKIRPVLVSRCYKCHSLEAEKVKGGLLADSREGLLKGGNSGPAIVPGKPEESLLVKAIRGTDDDMKMPPKGELLPAHEVADFEAWIRRGAPDPRKADVRAASRALGLPTWDRPASPCLSSRVPYGTPITAPLLARIDAAEQLLRTLGFRELRVRAHDTLARIEVPPADLPRLVEPAVRSRVTSELRALGFLHVTLDLLGFRSGSLNEGVVENTKGPAASPRAPRVR